MTERVLIEALAGRVFALEVEVAELKKQAEVPTEKATPLIGGDHSLYGTEKNEPPLPTEKVQGKWVRLSQVDMKPQERNVDKPVAFKTPLGKVTEVKGGWNGLKRCVIECFDLDETYRNKLLKGMSRHDCMKTCLELTGAMADQFYVAFLVEKE